MVFLSPEPNDVTCTHYWKQFAGVPFRCLIKLSRSPLTQNRLTGKGRPLRVVTTRNRDPSLPQNRIPPNTWGAAANRHCRQCRGYSHSAKSSNQTEQGRNGRTKISTHDATLLTNHVIDLGIHVVSHMYHLGIAFIGALGQDHLHKLCDDIDIRIFEIALL